MIDIPYIPCMTFNRRMIWLDDESILAGAVITYSAADCLYLTGQDAASDWWLMPEDGRLEPDGTDETRVILNSSKEVILRLLIHEFLIDQNPDLNFEIDSDKRRSSVKVIFERHFDYSPPLEAPLRTLFKSKPKAGKSKIKIPIASILRSRGYKTRYMRVSLHLVIGKGEPGSIRFRAWSNTKPVLVPQLPRSCSMKGNKNGVPVNAVFIDENGQALHNHDVRMFASMNKRNYEMKEIRNSGIFQARIRPGAEGIYKIDLKAVQKKNRRVYQSQTRISLTDGEFVAHVIDKKGRHGGYSRAGKHLGFLSGSTVLCDLIPALGVGTEKEDMILGISEFQKKTKITDGKADAILMTSINENELNHWLKHKKESGYRAFLMANWTPDILNAGGNISPYGAELASYLFDFCRQNDLYVKVDITHDTFARPSANPEVFPLPNLTQYKEAGFLRSNVKYPSRIEYYTYMLDQWCRPEVRRLTESYFRHFLLLFRDETSIILLSPCGEGDFELGSRIVNPLCDCIRRFDANHLIGIDQRAVFFDRFKTSYFNIHNVNKPFNELHSCVQGFSRSGRYKSDIYMSVVYRFFGLNPAGIYGEGDCFGGRIWFKKPRFTSIHSHPADESYKLLVRDFLWFSLIHRVFLAYNWNELLRAEEHLMPAKISQLIDWDHFEPHVPPVMLRVYPLEPANIEILMNYEEAFSSLGLDYGYIWGRDPLPDSTDLYVQPDRQIPPYLLLDIVKDGFKKDFFCSPSLTKLINQTCNVQLRSKGYSANSLLSKDLRQIIIYLRNTTNYIRHLPSQCERGNLFKSSFDIEIFNLPETRKCLRLYDLNDQSLLAEKHITSEWHYSKNNADHDFVIVVTPE